MSFGCHDSQNDPRTVVATDLAFAGVVPLSGKINIEVPSTNDLCNQRQLGICTKCSVRTAVEHHFKDGVRLSENWGYLIQKVMVDRNLTEGSSIFSALKSAKNYGIPTKDMELIFPLKTDGSYAEFVYDFNMKYGGEVPEQILENALKHKIAGYYSVPVDPISIAKEIQKDHVVMVRFTVGENTYTPSWRKADLEPLRIPTSNFGGHAWDITEYEGLDWNQTNRIINSWGRNWCDNGYVKFVMATQKPYFTEAWAISDEVLPPKKVQLTKDLKLGITDPDILVLQKFLNKNGFIIATVGNGSIGRETNYFGSLTRQALIRFQLANNIQPAIGFCGPITRAKINAILAA
jgi:hypothetical protein